ncbi:acyltransferase [Aliarcobacter butzleri]|uniref:acyltransferase n=1 Tax=Aliarcobacter butzleri TaxID=28197 RepID=UPI001EDAECE0|nr:acyltransferase [Aliarcobacter butzleri]MCG3672246.1 acyltransferase [Aliarcobacter butzleri]
MYKRIKKKLSFFKLSPSLFITNYIFQKILRNNCEFKYSKHFTSKILNVKNIKFDETSHKTLKSFFGSGGCYFNGANGIEIGSGTFWAVNVVIISETYDVLNSLKSKSITKPVIIGNNCWIGANVVIMPEVSIGNNVIIGAGSIVTKSFPSNCVIAGNPAKIIRELNVKN